jgi:drug/metabolite transporter (DMT)-like permease
LVPPRLVQPVHGRGGLAQNGDACFGCRPFCKTPVKPVLGISLKILSALAFTLMSAATKIVSSRYPVGEVVFFRSFFALLPVLLWLGWYGDLINAVRTQNLKWHFLRGITGCAGMFCVFTGLIYLPLHDAVAIGYATPLMVVVLAALLLHERVRAYRWSAVAVGFVGVMVMLLPHLGSGPLTAGSAVGALFALLGALLSAAASIQVRRLTATETTGAIVFYFSLLAALLGLTTAVLGWRMPGLADLALLISVGILGGIGQILMTQSYRYADASLIAPFEYTTMIWALLIGWFLFDDLPTAAVLIGAAIVAGSGVFLLWRESGQQRRELETAGRGPGVG